MWESIRAAVVTGIIAVFPAFLLVGILTGGWEEMTHELAALMFYGPLFLIIPLFFIVLGASAGLFAGVLAHVTNRSARKLAAAGDLLIALAWITNMPNIGAAGLIW